MTSSNSLSACQTTERPEVQTWLLDRKIIANRVGLSVPSWAVAAAAGTA
ncbi:hypothetical protein [Arthrobacter sp. zg-Y1171]|nr:hypothetical protein [Arthrobacter sp. zg-Y1171]MCQ1996872.1 hypothetical protein [Arthrobacter sp. zg-Y1171]UWX82460.1 hypothetical protein N2L00_03240 [Arthrobacter sp. zg-Y1171]